MGSSFIHASARMHFSFFWFLGYVFFHGVYVLFLNVLFVLFCFSLLLSCFLFCILNWQVIASACGKFGAAAGI